jgi:hypothetical protein
MNKKEQIQELDEIFAKIRKVIESKGDDYANQDRLSNFKLAGAICGVGAKMNCLSLIATKVARLGVLLNSTTPPNNESIEDSALDLTIYSILLSMILKDTTQYNVFLNYIYENKIKQTITNE